MKFEAIMRYCPLTASQKGWEIPLGEFNSKEEARTFLDKEVPQMQSAAVWKLMGNRMIFLIKDKKEEAV